MLNQTNQLQTRIDTGFVPIGLDMPYRVFISEDPIRFDINFYAYVGNPIRFTDPLGLFCVSWQYATESNKEVLDTYWRLLSGPTVIIPHTLVICTWGKYEKGKITEYITTYYICIEKCRILFGSETSEQTRQYEELIATRNTSATRIPYGGSSFDVYLCIKPRWMN